MRKIFVSLTVLLSFIAFFLFFYKNNFGFGRSIRCAFIALVVNFSVHLGNVGSVQAASEVDGFTPSVPAKTRPGPGNRGLFGRGAGSPGGDAPGNDDQFNVGDVRKRESVKETQKRLDAIKKAKEELAADSDSGSDNENSNEESNTCQVKVKEKFNKHSAVKRLAKSALKNQKIRKEYERILKKIEAETPLDKICGSSIRSKGNKFLIKGEHGRYLVESTDDGKQVNILGISSHGKMKQFKKLMNDLHDAGLQYSNKK